MPKIFSEEERNKIINDLRDSAMRELRLFGVKRTTVDELCKDAHLAKGSFYLFYESKEELFLDCMESFLEKAENLYVDMLQNLDENHIVTSLTEIFYTLALSFRNSGMFWFLDEENLTLIKRKVPEKRFKDALNNIDEKVHTLFSYFSVDSEEDIKIFEKSYLALLHLFLFPKGVGDDDKTIKYIIRGLVLQMVE